MHRGKVDPGVSELPRGNELSRDQVNRPLVLPDRGFHAKKFKFIPKGSSDCTKLLKSNLNGAKLT